MGCQTQGLVVLFWGRLIISNFQGPFLVMRLLHSSIIDRRRFHFEEGHRVFVMASIITFSSRMKAQTAYMSVMPGKPLDIERYYIGSSHLHQRR